jgi:predicted metal-binding membrane protein
MMAVLGVIGLMNVAWMAVFAVLFFLEKSWRHGVLLSRLSGAACIVLGVAVIMQPDVLHFVGGPME